MSQPTRPVRRALVSVSNKQDLEVLAASLVKHGVEVLSTGGTFKALSERMTGEGARLKKVSEHTGAPEILGGRVKTLHPRIHGGILALPTPEHEAELAEHDVEPIDLVVVNLYPFRETIAKPGATFEQAIENIDIGGPTMVRAAAKNWPRVAVVVDPEDYEDLAAHLDAHSGGITDGFRRRMARKAFAHTAEYDAAIATYLAAHDDDGTPTQAGGVPTALFVTGERVAELRYGENPHQSATFFRTDYAATEATGLDAAALHQGKALSYNNLLDADAALGIARDLKPLGRAAAVFKHLSPCGAAVAREGDSLADVYVRAREADAESAFGGIVSFTEAVDAATAERLVETFLEVIVAPAYAPGALEILARKKNLRVMEVPAMFDGLAVEPLRFRSVAGGVLVQREDRVGTSAAEGKVVTKRAPTSSELLTMDLGQRVGKHVRSNAVVLLADGATVGVGGGQTSRVEAVRQAVKRAGDRAKGAVLASDAFFPFRDNVDALAQAGVAAIIQPGGSKRDGEVIEAADEHGMAMVFTGERHFRH